MGPVSTSSGPMNGEANLGHLTLPRTLACLPSRRLRGLQARPTSRCHRNYRRRIVAERLQAAPLQTPHFYAVERLRYSTRRPPGANA